MNPPTPRPAPIVTPAEEITPPSLDPLDIQADSVSVSHPERPLANGLVRQVKRPGWRLRELETHWYQCLGYPIAAWPLLCVLSIVLTAVSGGIALALPRLLSEGRAEGTGLLWISLFCLPLLVVLGYVLGILDGAFTSALSGEIRGIRWPGRDISAALRSGAKWLICFLAGPLVPAGASLLFWLHGGDLLVLDWIILAETILLALTGWLLLVWAVNEQDRRRDLHPLRILAFLLRLDRRVVALAVAMSAVGMAHAGLASLALEKLHSETAVGWSLLLLCWVSGMVSATFVFRWVGVRLYWERIRAEVQPRSNPGGYLQ
ncbi:MAG TPA: hypothetical protein VKU02_17915 [Gemmataceae bacterium]|nr:hypothetical protein [Gemmataceae bacterium]